MLSSCSRLGPSVHFGTSFDGGVVNEIVAVATIVSDRVNSPVSATPPRAETPSSSRESPSSHSDSTLSPPGSKPHSSLQSLIDPFVSW